MGPQTTDREMIMENLSSFLERLKAIAPKMEALNPRLLAALRYDMWSGAVYWSDEIPNGIDQEAEDALRGLFRYRTTLILGKPEERLKPLWEAGKQFFPRWIGFSASRVSPTNRCIKK